MTKIKTEIEVPRTWGEAERLMRELAAARYTADGTAAEMKREIAEIEASYGDDLDAQLNRCLQLELALKKFAAAHKREFRAKEDGGDGRTRVVAGIEIGYEWGNPYIHIPKRFEEEAIAWLEETAGDTYVKRSPKIMRGALLAELGKAEETGDHALIDRMAANHIIREQDEEFVLRIKAEN